MARIKSSVKNIRKSRARNRINRARRSRLRTRLRTMRQLLARGDVEGARAALSATLAVIDRSKGKGTIHRNTAARYKSRLARRVVALEHPQ